MSRSASARVPARIGDVRMHAQRTWKRFGSTCRSVDRGESGGNSAGGGAALPLAVTVRVVLLCEKGAEIVDPHEQTRSSSTPTSVGHTPIARSFAKSPAVHVAPQAQRQRSRPSAFASTKDRTAGPERS